MLQNGLQRRTAKIWAFIAISILACALTISSYSHETGGFSNGNSSVGPIKTDDGPKQQRLRILLPATDPNLNLCKTLLSAAILDYPTPVLVAWNEKYDKSWLLGGGSHIAKISRVLDKLKVIEKENKDDIVLMMDAYDLWFQLPPQVLINRYHAINAEANQRIEKRMGRAASIEGIKQTVIFGAGKRCAPNEMHMIACYSIPESPIPSDTYGGNTDTMVGRNKYSSFKQRFLNSGFIMGPVSDMVAVFARAQELVDTTEEKDPDDNGSGEADFLYHGSDQSIFNTIFGQQEFQREVMRRRHFSWWDSITGKQKIIPTRIQGTIVNDPINPSFTHQQMEHYDGKPFEFGIGLDYLSQLTHQTINADHDARWLRYNESLQEQLKPATDRGAKFDCPPRVKGTLPQDILDGPAPFASTWDNHGMAQDAAWHDVPLYTNVCLDTIPVLIHHNGAKHHRVTQWDQLWTQPHARAMLAAKQTAHPNGNRGGAMTDKGWDLSWQRLCPSKYEADLFRDVEKKPEEGKDKAKHS